jgi:chromosome partitioning protein
MITLALVNLKSGSGKTTSAGYFGQTLYERKLRIIGFDTDGESRGFHWWAKVGPLPFPVESLVVKKDLHMRIPGIIGNRFDAVVIDTPPMRESRQIVLSAVMLATHVVVPMVPTMAEYNRLPAVNALLDEVGWLTGTRPPWSVLFNRCESNSISRIVFREMVNADYGNGTVLQTEVAYREVYAQAQGKEIKNATNTSYGDALTEIMAAGPMVNLGGG